MKKGFTLVELLATIIILGVVATIAIPTVRKLFDSSTKESLVLTSKGLNDAFANKCMLEKMAGSNINNIYYIENNNIYTELDKKANVDYKGSLPTYGKYTFTNDCKSNYTVVNGKYCVTKNNEKINSGIWKNNECYYEDSGELIEKPATDESCFGFDNGAITSYSDTCPKDIVIPKTINGQNVTAILDYAFNNTDIYSIDFRNATELEVISYNAFYTEFYGSTIDLSKNTNLKIIAAEGFNIWSDIGGYDVKIPNSIQEFGRYNFNGIKYLYIYKGKNPVDNIFNMINEFNEFVPVPIEETDKYVKYTSRFSCYNAGLCDPA